MADPAKQRATYEDVLAAPPNLVAQVLDSVIITLPVPFDAVELELAALWID